MRTLLTNLHAEEVFTTIVFNPGVFCQMLAKIAHGYAVAERGLHSFEPLLLKLILETRQCDVTNYVGGFIGTDQKFTLSDGSSPHEICLVDLDNVDGGKQILLAYIQLFADLGAPVYQVVVGRAS